MSKEPIKKVDLVVSGENLKQTGTLLSTAVMYGLLKATEEGINMVNAPSIAKDNGIEVGVFKYIKLEYNIFRPLKRLKESCFVSEYRS